MRDEATEDGEPEGLDRKEFLAGAAVGAGALIVTTNALALTPPAPSGLDGLAAAPKAVDPVVVDITRREDLLHLRFQLFNVKRSGPNWVRRNTKKSAYLVVTFVPQHLTERAYLKPDASSTKDEKPQAPGEAQALLARGTRLAFKLPKGKSIPATVEGLLNWTALVPSLVPVAQATAIEQAKPGAKRPKIAEPGSKQTRIELPWRLVLSPTTTGRWRHASAAVTLDGWTELWQTHLQNGLVDGGPIRAVWNEDRVIGGPTLAKAKPPSPSTNPFRTSLDRNDRHQIVRASSDFTVAGRADVRSERLQLSALGGLLDARGAWVGLQQDGLDIEEWKHLATYGRDHFVRVVRQGYLFPFGHKAVQVKVTERLFEKVGTQPVATLRQFLYLVVREPVKSYRPTETYGIKNDSRDLPFRRIEITTARTPNLGVQSPFAGFSDVYVPTVAGGPFRFAMIGTDWADRRIEFNAPAVFVPGVRATDEANAKAIRERYASDLTPKAVRTGRVGGRKVAFAEPRKAGDTDVDVQDIVFGAGAGTGGPTSEFVKRGQPRTYPNVAFAEVLLPMAEALSGGADLGKAPVVKFAQAFLDNKWDAAANAGQVFLEMLPANIPPLTFAGGSAGGVMTPNLLISGLSRSIGPVAGDLGTLAAGTFDPKQFFAGLPAKILGGVDLADLIAAVPAKGDIVDSEVLKISTERVGTALVTTLKWTPQIVKNNPIITPIDDKFDFALDAKITADPLNPDAADYEVSGRLKGFRVNLMGESAAKFIVITFESLSFEAKKGKKADPDVDIEKVEFVGALAFVDKLKDFMKFAGEGGPAIDVQPSGVSLEVSVGLPALTVGLFSISNIRIGAGFNLPFDGSPARFRFDFSKRDDPFALQVAIFGGTGFFGLAIGTDGVELIEAALEFGAMASLDIGIASGGVHLLAGVYFSYGVAEGSDVETCVLTGYVRLGGELNILGLIHLSLEFYMGLTYTSPPKRVYGEAILTVEVGILFFSFSVELKVRREFGGSGENAPRGVARGSGVDGTATFADQMAQPDWDEYCDAFAAA